MYLLVVSFIVIALLLNPAVLFLANRHPMKRIVNRAAKSETWHLALTLQDWGKRGGNKPGPSREAVKCNGKTPG